MFFVLPPTFLRSFLLIWSAKPRKTTQPGGLSDQQSQAGETGLTTKKYSKIHDLRLVLTRPYSGLRLIF